MKTENFDNMKPTANHAEFTKDFCAGYDSAADKIKSSSPDSFLSEFNLANPSGMEYSSMAAYFYAKGELAALLDNK